MNSIAARPSKSKYLICNHGCTTRYNISWQIRNIPWAVYTAYIKHDQCYLLISCAPHVLLLSFGIPFVVESFLHLTSFISFWMRELSPFSQRHLPNESYFHYSTILFLILFYCLSYTQRLQILTNLFWLQHFEHLSHDNSCPIASRISQHKSWRGQHTFQLQVLLQVVRILMAPFSNTPTLYLDLLKKPPSFSVLQLRRLQVATANDVLEEKICFKNVGKRWSGRIQRSRWIRSRVNHMLTGGYFKDICYFQEMEDLIRRSKEAGWQIDDYTFERKYEQRSVFQRFKGLQKCENQEPRFGFSTSFKLAH